MNFKIENIRSDFPILHQQVYGKPLIYLDNAATTQKPKVVIDALSNYYKTINSNIHRGVHFLSQQATDAYEQSRRYVQQTIHSAHSHEIIFTRGTTESINLIASSFGKKFVNEEDEIIISTMEHHSNIVPWQLMCEERKAKIRIIPIDENGELIFEEIKNLINEKTKLIAVAHVSNTLGTINPIHKIIELAHLHNIPILIDGAQAVSHIRIDVQELDCDFYCFSAHKVYGPMGIGVLYGKEKWLEELPPYQGGGEMIKNVTFEKTTFNELPFKFEAGTPSVGDALGLEVALRYVDSIGIENIAVHENNLLKYATEKLTAQIENVRIIGTAGEKTSVLSFLVGNIHPSDLGTILDKLGVAVRTGHHCTQILMDRFCIPGTVRASFAMYNSMHEVDAFTDAVVKANSMLV